MKKLLIFIFSAMLALSAAAFAACENREDDTTEDIIDSNIQSQIIDAWLEKNTINNVNTSELSVDVRGVYGDSYVFYLNGPFNYGSTLTHSFIDNVYFAYPDSHQLEVYNSGIIYTLEEAFDAQLLTRENLLDIQKNYNKGDWNWSTTGIIIQDYISEKEYLSADDITLRVHWYSNSNSSQTIYTGIEYFAMFVDGEGHDWEITEEVIDGITFTYPSSQQLLLYGAYDSENATNFITLSRAFDLGLLDREQLLEIKHNYENGILIYLD